MSRGQTELHLQATLWLERRTVGATSSGASRRLWNYIKNVSNGALPRRSTCPARITVALLPHDCAGLSMAENGQPSAAGASETNLKRELSGRSSDPAGSHQIAHTLTACSRCRAVSRACYPLRDTVEIDLPGSGKHDVTPVFRDAVPARGQTRIANITTRRKEQ